MPAADILSTKEACLWRPKLKQPINDGIQLQLISHSMEHGLKLKLS